MGTGRWGHLHMIFSPPQKAPSLMRTKALGLGDLTVSSSPSPGIFAFKCSRAEDIFNLLQDLMQCNSINVTEEPVVITRTSHPAEPAGETPPVTITSPVTHHPLLYTHKPQAGGPKSRSR